MNHVCAEVLSDRRMIPSRTNIVFQIKCASLFVYSYIQHIIEDLSSTRMMRQINTKISTV